MSRVDCVHMAISGVTRRKTLRSLCVEFGWSAGDTPVQLLSIESALTFRIVTDDYDDDSSGLFDGSEHVDAQKVREFVTSALKLGSPLLLLRNQLPVKQIGIDTRFDTIRVPATSIAVLASEIRQPLPLDNLFVVRAG